MTTQEIFINNLKFYRKHEKLTQAQLATFIDKSFNYINGVECGVSFPPPDVIDKIAEVLKIKPIQLFDENGCSKNIINNKREIFIEDLANKLTEKIQKNIKDEIRKELSSLLNY